MKRKKKAEIISNLIIALCLLLAVGLMLAVTNNATQMPSTFGVKVQDSLLPIYADTEVDITKSCEFTPVSILDKPIDYSYKVVGAKGNYSYKVNGGVYSLEGVDITSIVSTTSDGTIKLDSKLELLDVLSELHNGNVILTENADLAIFVLIVTNNDNNSTLNISFSFHTSVKGIELSQTEMEF